MKKEIINNMLSGNEIYHRKTEFTCGICKSDKLPDNIFNKREIKSLLNKFKMKSTDLSSIITKCNCNKNSPKAHKLCALLNVIYNFELKCPDCHADYNLSVQIHNIPAQKACNIIQLILVLLINIIIYGACAFLILLPLVIDKEYYEGDEKKMYFVALCFFAALLFLINTYLTYVTFFMFLVQNPNDPNSYALDIKDINGPNRNKNNDKFYKLLYKFFRDFYKTQMRYLVAKKHKMIFISKGYGSFNKELQEMIIKNNIECEKKMEEINNGGDEILGLKINKISKKSRNEKEENNKSNNIEKSNGNIDNSDISEDSNKNKEDKNINHNNKISSNNNLSSNLNFASKKNNDILKDYKNEKKSIDITSKKSNSKQSEKSNESLKQKKKKIVIEIINTDKTNKEIKNFTTKEEKKNQDSESNKTKKNSESNMSKKSRNKNNEIESMSSKDLKLNNKKFEESKDSFINKKEKKNKMDADSSIKNKLINEPNIFNDNENIFVSTPLHNNGK